MTEETDTTAAADAGESGKKKPRSRLRRLLTSCVRIVALVYVGLGAVLYFFQSRLVYRPDSEIVNTPRDVGLDYEDLTLQAEDGTELSAWYVPADGAEHVILFCHGNGGNISHRLDSLHLFHRMGLSVLMFDYRGYGRSKGKPSEEGTYQDARAAWDFLADERQISPDRIIIHGRSLGGAVAARLAKDRQAKALILESTFTSVPKMGAELYPYLPIRWLCRFSYDTQSILPEIECPVLVIHSPEDDLVAISHGRALFEAAGQPKQFLEISGTHNEGYYTSGDVYTDGLKGFLAEHARPRPASRPSDAAPPKDS